MSELKNISILFIVVFAASMLRSTEAIDHIVGSRNGWIIPVDGHSFYSDWASNITFKENDVLVFNFVTGRHTVVELNQTYFENCNVNQNIQFLDTSPSPVRFTLNRTGVFYFTCSIPGHCASGQKLIVNVSASSPALSQGPSSPTSSVSSDIHIDLVATFSILIAAVAVNFLF
ncbi:putative cupredoxin [Medicago truncatula]|uniref:Plastocyanin-like domain protein n=1 Tax=Medicago truncatula TaxID=3880 RepID=A0A072UKQ5_MEDTR|nr:mavicyanin [Medicago truncatula]XP_039689076.1 mavicyanin-like [Medicago truncatula]KEH30268.1 plastocyanin-like domain protein [Medicago truncatula]KEH30324.1 plastocyanin-like domain protein [Medicago truncatula]RHN61113.1 putative cupredoxin [Medicago truncatula]RHN61151.1 putative cupredoxin [Medicago truncatula]